MERPVLIGALTDAWGPTPTIVGLRDGLVALGYREDTDFVIGVRFAQGNLNRLPEMTRSLASSDPDIVWADAAPAALAAKRLMRDVPIVFIVMMDPVGLGLIESYARPGGNLTGVANLDRQTAGKRLELFKQMVPRLRRVMYPYDAARVDVSISIDEYRAAAKQLGIELIERPLHSEEEARRVIGAIRIADIDGLVISNSPALNVTGLALEASERGIPTMFTSSFLVEMGGLTSYGPDSFKSGRQAARLVAKIMEGENPGEIPVEVNNDIEFVINLKTAKALGIEIPRLVLYQASRIIR